MIEPVQIASDIMQIKYVIVQIHVNVRVNRTNITMLIASENYEFIFFTLAASFSLLQTGHMMRMYDCFKNIECASCKCGYGGGGGGEGAPWGQEPPFW